MPSILPHNAPESNNASEGQVWFKCAEVGWMGVVRTEVVIARPQQRRLGHKEVGRAGEPPQDQLS